uniref:Uncharacterized protein n=1 Tax=Oryza brachyantha TaxID=4533 RepID=J3L0G6_ORYBR
MPTGIIPEVSNSKNRWLLVFRPFRNSTNETDIVKTVWSKRGGDQCMFLQKGSLNSPSLSRQSSSNMWGQRSMLIDNVPVMYCQGPNGTIGPSYMDTRVISSMSIIECDGSSNMIKSIELKDDIAYANVLQTKDRS